MRDTAERRPFSHVVAEHAGLPLVLAAAGFELINFHPGVQSRARMMQVALAGAGLALMVATAPRTPVPVKWISWAVFWGCTTLLCGVAIGLQW